MDVSALSEASLTSEMLAGENHATERFNLLSQTDCTTFSESLGFSDLVLILCWTKELRIYRSLKVLK